MASSYSPHSADGWDGEEESWIVDCPCGVTYDDGDEMVECDHCGVWVHTHCCNVPKSAKTYICQPCNGTNAPADINLAKSKKRSRKSAVLNPGDIWQGGSTDIPIEDRVHVHGDPCGDSKALSNHSRAFSRQLWKYSGHVPKAIHFPFSDLPPPLFDDNLAAFMAIDPAFYGRFQVPEPCQIRVLPDAALDLAEEKVPARGMAMKQSSGKPKPRVQFSHPIILPETVPDVPEIVSTSERVQNQSGDAFPAVSLTSNDVCSPTTQILKGLQSDTSQDSTRPASSVLKDGPGSEVEKGSNRNPKSMRKAAIVEFLKDQTPVLGPEKGDAAGQSLSLVIPAEATMAAAAAAAAVAVAVAALPAADSACEAGRSAMAASESISEAVPAATKSEVAAPAVSTPVPAADVTSKRQKMDEIRSVPSPGAVQVGTKPVPAVKQSADSKTSEPPAMQVKIPPRPDLVPDLKGSPDCPPGMRHWRGSARTSELILSEWREEKAKLAAAMALEAKPCPGKDPAAAGGGAGGSQSRQQRQQSNQRAMDPLKGPAGVRKGSGSAFVAESGISTAQSRGQLVNSTGSRLVLALTPKEPPKPGPAKSGMVRRVSSQEGELKAGAAMDGSEERERSHDLPRSHKKGGSSSSSSRRARHEEETRARVGSGAVKSNSSAMLPPIAPTNQKKPPMQLTLLDEEIALRLHQELNSSPRVPRVPRSSLTSRRAPGVSRSSLSGGNSVKAESRGRVSGRASSCSGDSAGREGSRKVPAVACRLAAGTARADLESVDKPAQERRQSPDQERGVELTDLVREVIEGHCSGSEATLDCDSVVSLVCEQWQRVRGQAAGVDRQQAIMECLQASQPWSAMLPPCLRIPAVVPRRRRNSNSESDSDSRRAKQQQQQRAVAAIKTEQQSSEGGVAGEELSEDLGGGKVPSAALECEAETAGKQSSATVFDSVVRRLKMDMDEFGTTEEVPKGKRNARRPRHGKGEGLAWARAKPRVQRLGEQGEERSEGSNDEAAAMAEGRKAKGKEWGLRKERGERKSLKRDRREADMAARRYRSVAVSAGDGVKSKLRMGGDSGGGGGCGGECGSEGDGAESDGSQMGSDGSDDGSDDDEEVVSSYSQDDDASDSGGDTVEDDEDDDE